ncbi:hypothetical protein COU60_01240 [Candidatus Pacearchaeota archaeon CG10_big_fil_rev_8_21_14_0_10_34_76]|nr:MAG: hypothetical protein COU60_01240 [Candidatus Pacearchaeota archaeon CG10_big_fil_rev_8_21_14_0_10_34_76]
MKLLGINFTNVSAKRNIKLEKIEKISTNIEFTNIEKDNIEIMKDSKILKISFKFSIEYETKQAELTFEGILLLSTTEDILDKTIKDWKKKKMNDELKVPVFNIILNKCSLKALQMEEDLGLPLHISLPKIQKPAK